MVPYLVTQNSVSLNKYFYKLQMYQRACPAFARRRTSFTNPVANVLPWTLATHRQCSKKSKHSKNNERSHGGLISLIYKKTIKFKCLCMCVHIHICTDQSHHAHRNIQGSEVFAFPFLNFCEQLGHDFKLLYLKILKKKKTQTYRKTERKVCVSHLNIKNEDLHSNYCITHGRS